MMISNYDSSMLTDKKINEQSSKIGEFCSHRGVSRGSGLPFQGSS